MSKILGKNCIVFIQDGGVWKIYGCARSATLNVTTDFIETSVSGQGNFSTYAPSKNSYTGTLDGLTSLEVVGILSLPDLRQRQIAQNLLLMRFQRTDLNGNVYTDEASFYISSSEDMGSFDNMNTFSIGLRGSGPLTQVFTPVVPVPVGGILVYRYEFTGILGQTILTADGTGGTQDLRNKTILEVNVDGEGLSPIITSGTPLGTEVKYIAASGQFIFPIPLEAGEECYILYQ